MYAGSREAYEDFRQKVSKFLFGLTGHKSRFQVGDLVRTFCYPPTGHPYGSYELAMVLRSGGDISLTLLIGEAVRHRSYLEVLTLAEYNQLARTAEYIGILASDEEFPSCPKIKEELSAMFSTILKK